MTQVTCNRLLALTPDQAFNIAADVGNYPKFVPLVTAANILGEVKGEGAVKRFAATLAVHGGAMLGTQSFTSQVEADQSSRTVTATSSDGPLSSLRCMWSFKPMAGSRCQAMIQIDYEFKSKLMQFGASAVMDKAVERVLQAFEARGHEVYPMSAIPNI